ncbi:hypothetical protein BH10BAC5_BH10BAC5_04590 [soil metagenome]
MELTKQEIAIKDACILIDLYELNLFDDFFQLDIISYTTPQIISEIKNVEQAIKMLTLVNSCQLKIDSEGDIQAIYEISTMYSALSLADCSVLESAARKKAIILSSDGTLRKISNSENLIVRGILWIIEELYNKTIITKQTAIEKLDKYKSINAWAPLNEIKKLVAKLSNK